MKNGDNFIAASQMRIVCLCVLLRLLRLLRLCPCVGSLIPGRLLNTNTEAGDYFTYRVFFFFCLCTTGIITFSDI